MIIGTSLQSVEPNAQWIGIDNTTKHKIPAGVIRDLQITAANRVLPIYLTSCRSRQGTLTLIFRDANNELVASGTVDKTSVPVSLDGEPGCTGNILLGYIPEGDQEFVTSPIQISRELVSTYTPSTNQGCRVKLTQDGETLIDDVLTGDTILEAGYGVKTISTASDQVAVIQVSDPYMGLKVSENKDTARIIKSINNIKKSKISIQILVGDESPEYTLTNNTLTIDASKLTEKLLAKDPLDLRIGPNNVEGRDYTYYPLDDAYLKLTDSGYTLAYPRDTVQGIPGVYMFSPDGGLWTTDICTIDISYDREDLHDH